MKTYVASIQIETQYIVETLDDESEEAAEQSAMEMFFTLSPEDMQKMMEIHLQEIS